MSQRISRSGNRDRDSGLPGSNFTANMSHIEWKAIPYSILPEMQPKARMASPIGTLCSYSFVAKRHEEKQYDMHRLVHLAVRIQTKQHGRPAEVPSRATLHLANVFP